MRGWSIRKVGLEAVKGKVDYLEMSQQGEVRLGRRRGSLRWGLEGYAKVIIRGKGGFLSSDDPGEKQKHNFG